MDNEQGNDNHPVYDSAKESITPDFGQHHDSEETAANKLGMAEKLAASGISKATGGVVSAKNIEKLGGFFSGKGRAGGGDKKTKGGLTGKKSAVAFLALGVGILIVGVGMIGNPIFMIGMLDLNLQRSTGWTSAENALKEQTKYVAVEIAKSGELPAEYANDLAAAGLYVGQVTLAGDFVRTNKYIANIEELDDIAVVGSGFTTKGSDGELAFLFEGEVIKADDFVAAVEANPRMYAAFSEGTDISARYYYSKDVDKAYNEMGIKRNAYQGWQATGDDKQDEANFEEILVSVLNTDTNTEMAGCDDNYCDESSTGSGNAEEVVNATGSAANGTDNAAQLLNSAITSEEPYKAARAFMAIEEPIQRTRIDGDGPANEVMNTLNEATTIVYTDVETGEKKTKTASILETPNFVAAVSGGKISMNEALNASRDRVLVATNTGNGLIKDTTLSVEGADKFGSATDRGSGSVDYDKLSKTVSSVSIATKEKNSDLFRSVVGGNRIVEGGSFLSSTINQRVLGAMPSDEATISNYNREVGKMMKKEAEVERATKSPFDISSPYTFLGSIAHNMAAILVRNHLGGGSISLTAITGATADLAQDSMKGIMSGAMADGSSDDFLDTFGDYCKNVPSTGAKADAYCTQITTVETGYMEKTKEYWDDYMKDHKKEYEDFVLYSMDRGATVGPNSAEVCKRYKERNSNIIDETIDALSKLMGVYKECRGVDDSIATGSGMVMGDENPDASKIRKFSAYTLHDTVYSLLSESRSTASVILEDYYKEHPLDNSRAGIIARRSGMDKGEVEIALAYAEQLAEIARYDASERYNFGNDVAMMIPTKDKLMEHSEKINGDLYCFWRGRNEYGDMRNRNFA